MANINKSRLFTASCMALTVTSMTFAIRAGMIEPLGKEFNLSNTELGWITGMAFFGFPVATTLGGFFVDTLGMKKWMVVAFAAHLLGLILTIFAGGFWTLFLSTFLVGFANGMVEAVCNPLVASMYPNNKTAMLNKFHVWFPGGIVIGSLISKLMTDGGMGWQLQVATILIPTVIYAFLFLGQEFPKTERVASGVSVSEMFSACVSPLFLFMMGCMFLTANTELSTTQWVGKLLGNAGADPLLILALVTGLMAVGRYFGEPIIHKLNPTGILLVSAVLAAVGIFMLKSATGNMVYAAAIIFALGVCFFWPTMLGFVSEYIPKSGALGMSLMGGMGMLGNWAYQTFLIGPKLDNATKVLNMSELEAGQSVLSSIGILPIVLIAAFGGLYFFMRGKEKVSLSHG
ncbi:MAG: MFS transporter [Saprospiraceae bacterium]|nr:MFS transporter [Saprospiraceae bacterium]